MSTLTCLLGAYDGGSIPPASLALAGVEVDEYLRRIGMTAAGTPLIDPTVVVVQNVLHQHPPGTPLPQPVTALDLHGALRKLTNINPGFQGLRRKVGVVYADSWEGNADVFGVMFDVGFEDFWLGSNQMYGAVAREGCGVFVGAIQRQRAALGATAEAIRQQIAWTTLHELGHLFNLWHQPDPVRFMTQSDPTGVYDPGNPPLSAAGQPRDVQYAFAPDHVSFLASCLSGGTSAAAARYAWPGGVAFGVRGGNWPVDVNYREALEGPRSRLSLALRIDLDRTEAWSFDPIELDVGLHITGNRRSPIHLPATLDPGYDDFAIWIEPPDGSRLRYRSPRRYCENHGRITVAPKRPFLRDISLFGQSGGYTFQQSGVHRLFATWRLPNGHLIESNRVEIEIKDGRGLRRLDLERRQTLTRPAVARLLYHRGFGGSQGERQSAVRSVRELARTADDRKLEVALAYALGRAYARSARRGGRGAERAYAVRKAVESLRTVTENADQASPRRLHHSVEWLDRLSQDR